MQDKNDADSVNSLEDAQSKIKSLEKQLSAFTQVSQAISGILDSEAILKLITDKLVNVMDVSFATIWTWDANAERLYLRHANAPQLALSLASTIMGKSINEAVSLSAKNPDHHKNVILKSLVEDQVIVNEKFEGIAYSFLNSAPSAFIEKMIGMKQAVHLPLKANGETLGVLGVVLQDKRVDENFVDLCEGFASQVSTTIYNSLLFEKVTSQVSQLESQNKDLASLYKLTSSVGQSLDPTKVSQAAADALPQDDFMAGAVIFLNDETKHLLIPTAASENEVSQAAIKLIGDLRKYAVSTRDPEIRKQPYMKTLETGIAQFTDELDGLLGSAIPKVFLPQLKKILGVKSIAIYPLQAHGKITGAVEYFIKSHTSEELDVNQKQLLNTYSLQIAYAVENAKIYEQSQETQKSLEKTLEELQEARRKERDMIDVLGHELRTPISIVRNALFMLEREVDKAEGSSVHEDRLEKYLKIGQNSVKREINLIETLLSATKVDGARLQLYLTQVDLDSIIQETITTHKPDLEKSNLTVDYVSPEEQIFAYADKNRMQEVIDNFLTNAIKYTPSGSITIRHWDDPARVWTMIRDTGIGVDEKEIHNLGKKFFRAKQYTGDSKNVIRPGGTGLGLYVTFELIRIMGGALHVNSTVGKGTTFTFSLPKYRDQEDKQFDQTFDAHEVSERKHIFFNEPAPTPPTKLLTSHI